MQGLGAEEAEHIKTGSRSENLELHSWILKQHEDVVEIFVKFPEVEK